MQQFLGQGSGTLPKPSRLRRLRTRPFAFASLTVLICTVALLLQAPLASALGFNPSLAASLDGRTIVLTGEGFPKSRTASIETLFGDIKHQSTAEIDGSGTFATRIEAPNDYTGMATITVSARYFLWEIEESTTPTDPTSPTDPTTPEATTPTQPETSIPATNGGTLSLPRIPWEGGAAYYANFKDTANAGWTDPNHFPVMIWWDNAETDEQIKWDKDHGINTYVIVNPQMDYRVLERNNMHYIGGQLPNMPRSSPIWVGDFLDDEVDGRSKTPAEGHATLTNTVNALPDHNKIRYPNYTGMVIQIWMPKEDASTYVNKFSDVVSIDTYIYTTPFCDWKHPDGGWSSETYYLNSLPNETCRTAHSYGKLTDALRSVDARDGKLQPTFQFTETVHGTVDYPAKLTPTKVKGMAMQTLIHEARGLMWFNQAFFGECITGNAIQTARANPNWPCANLITAMGEVNNQVHRLAPVLNTQSYEWNAGPGVDTMLKEKDGYAYLFVGTDGRAGTKTFKLPPEIKGTVAEVVDEARTVSVNNNTITDTFPDEATYHIYKIALS